VVAALRALAVLGFGAFAGATLMLFPAALAGFRQFPDDPALAGALATRQFDGYAPIAWVSLGAALAAAVALRARSADRATLPLVAGAATLACVATWLLVMRPVIDRAGAERRTAPTAAARADADARFRLWHGASMVLALASLLGGAAATLGASRVRD
jgi:hypothetical protein